MSDRGASPVELAIVAPLIILLLFVAIQIASIFIARSAALSAAQEAVSAQRAYQAPPGVGISKAQAFLANTSEWLGAASVVPAPAPADEVAFTVTGQALSVIPGVSFPVSQTAHGTIERFTVD
ncbi:pilus assembly protein [Asanoa sp. WMMD1127]|uniref:TadE family protein n=1 Tax=Asanoa sp. WMMD1127 TaxID=3016107 RepID=UPI002416D6E2|nr:TadE family protein [Asanoa sp. WMMD1127]MDG4821871.1 pilus assembly protein [Asanoa sp. WMMD1127]